VTDRLLACLSLSISVVLFIVLLWIQPHADFKAVQEQDVVPVKVAFTNLSTHASECLWVFGDGATSSAWNPTHTYDQPGTYHPMLIVRTRWGSVDWSYSETMIPVVGLPPELEVNVEDSIEELP